MTLYIVEVEWHYEGSSLISEVFSSVEDARDFCHKHPSGDEMHVYSVSHKGLDLVKSLTIWFRRGVGHYVESEEDF